MYNKYKMYFRTDKLTKKGLEVVDLEWTTSNILVSLTSKN